jgi:hypothetical protein
VNKLIFLIVALHVVTGAAFAQPPMGYMGLFADESHSVWCATGAGFYSVTMWVWCLPSERGMICADFAISYPVNVIPSTVTYNPELGIIIPDPPYPDGLSLCFQGCRWDWVWLFHRDLWVTDQTQTYIEIVKYPDPGVEHIQFANCEPGYPLERCIKYTNLYLNYEPSDPECIGTETMGASWGAIKSMINE